MKIPDRSFLIDIGLVGIGCFTIVWCLMPVQQHWTAKLTKQDGSVASFRVDLDTEDPRVVRTHVMERLRPNHSGEMGLQRWRAESANFYAKANARVLATDVTGEVELAEIPASAIQTVSHRTSLEKTNATRWQAFWQQREEQLSQAITKVEALQLARRAELGKSISVVRETTYVMQRSWLTFALTMSLAVIAIGTLWRLVFPPATLKMSDSEQQGAALDSSSMPGTETAAMCFRSSWVRARQPFRVWSRSVCGWTVVLASFVMAVAKLV